MWAEWAEGQDIGQTDVLENIAESCGMEKTVVGEALANSQYEEELQANWAQAQALGVIGVPSFVIGEEIFWGNDRFDFVLEHLRAL